MRQGIIGIVVLVGLLTCLVIQPVMAETTEDLFLKGQELADQGKYDQAIQAYDQALATDQKNDQIYYFKGNALLYQKKYQEAIDAYTTALSINPQNKAAQHNLDTAKTQMAQASAGIPTVTPTKKSPVSPLIVLGALGLFGIFRRKF
ncbi:tetratricopeptide repeat protein [Methanosphaerula palustris]|uniref:TPR repeat-containing protein n=1 Tax=Methanosphaerula palustris (strain ATCC BAA-1556 / DSM 19958 / E1-9c) TaxID=521011 RepID=B8GGT6_METPE|nr:tetratricopeptide repeat protein [Methanosphaerula palustris]ACL16341.1 TPR repeat-containing protein [Methanosphaerula palustris E1-9c]